MPMDGVSRSLRDVDRICQDIGSKKPASSKKAIKDLQELLSSNRMLGLLDTRTRMRETSGTWDVVVLAALDLVCCECVNASLGKSCESRLREITLYLRWTFNIAEGRGPMLHGVIKEVYTLFSECIIRDTDVFFYEICTILYQHILNVDAYCSSLVLKREVWNVIFVNIADRLDVQLSKSHRSNNAYILARSLAAFTDHFPPVANYSMVIGRFESLFDNVTFEDRDATSIPCLFRAFNNTMLSASLDIRYSCCRIARHVIENVVVRVWSTKVHDCPLRWEMILFARIFMRLSYPMCRGALRYEAKDAVRKLYSKVFSDISSVSRKSVAFGDRYQRIAFFDLAAQLFARVAIFDEMDTASSISNDDDDISDKDLTPTFQQNNSLSSLRKRRKRCDAWVDMTDGLKSKEAGIVGPWIRISTLVMGRRGLWPGYADDEASYIRFSCEARTQLISRLLFLIESKLPGEKAIEAQIWALHCLCEIARSTPITEQEEGITTFFQSSLSSSKYPTDDLYNSSDVVDYDERGHLTYHGWKRVWNASVQFVGLRKVPDVIFMLLRVMLENRLVDPRYLELSQDLFWRTFTPSRLSVAMLRFFDVFVRSFRLDEQQSSFGPGFSVDRSNEVPREIILNYPLRSRLIMWLLVSMKDVTTPTVFINRGGVYEVSSGVPLNLTMKNASKTVGIPECPTPSLTFQVSALLATLTRRFGTSQDNKKVTDVDATIQSEGSGGFLYTRSTTRKPKLWEMFLDGPPCASWQDNDDDISFSDRHYLATEAALDAIERNLVSATRVWNKSADSQVKSSMTCSCDDVSDTYSSTDLVRTATVSTTISPPLFMLRSWCGISVTQVIIPAMHQEVINNIKAFGTSLISLQSPTHDDSVVLLRWVAVASKFLSFIAGMEGGFHTVNVKNAQLALLPLIREVLDKVGGILDRLDVGSMTVTLLSLRSAHDLFCAGWIGIDRPCDPLLMLTDNWDNERLANCGFLGFFANLLYEGDVCSENDCSNSSKSPIQYLVNALFNLVANGIDGFTRPEENDSGRRKSSCGSEIMRDPCIHDDDFLKHNNDQMMDGNVEYGTNNEMNERVTMKHIPKNWDVVRVAATRALMAWRLGCLVAHTHNAIIRDINGLAPGTSLPLRWGRKHDIEIWARLSQLFSVDKMKRFRSDINPWIVVEALRYVTEQPGCVETLETSRDLALVLLKGKSADALFCEGLYILFLTSRNFVDIDPLTPPQLSFVDVLKEKQLQLFSGLAKHYHKQQATPKHCRLIMAAMSALVFACPAAFNWKFNVSGLDVIKTDTSVQIHRFLCITMLTDADFGVRLLAAPILSRFMPIFPSGIWRRIAKRVSGMISSYQIAIHQEVTSFNSMDGSSPSIDPLPSLLIMAESACLCHEYEPDAILFIWSRLYSSPSLHYAGRSILSSLARRLGYTKDNVMHCLLLDHLRYVLFKWHLELPSSTVFDLPISLIGYSEDPIGMSLFLANHLYDVLSHLFSSPEGFRNVDAVLVRIATAMEKSIEWLVDKALFMLLALSIPFDFRAGNNLATRAVLAMAEERVGPERSHQIIWNRLDNLIMELIFSVNAGDNNVVLVRGGVELRPPPPSPPTYSTHDIEKSIKHIITLLPSDGTNPEDIEGLLSATSTRIPAILDGLAHNIDKSVRRHKRIWYLSQLRVFIVMVGQQLCNPVVLRRVIQTVLHSIDLPGMHKECAVILDMICTRALRNSPEELARYLPAIIASLVPHVNNDDLSENCSVLLTVIHRLVDERAIESTAYINALRLLDPFPESNIFNEVRKELKTVQGTRTLHDEILRFLIAERRHDGSNGNDLTRIASIRHLQRELSSKKLELQSLLDQNEHLSKRLIGTLISMCGGGGVGTVTALPALRHAVGACLGELGAVDIHSTVMHVSTSEKMVSSWISAVSSSGRNYDYSQLDSFSLQSWNNNGDLDFTAKQLEVDQLILYAVNHYMYDAAHIEVAESAICVAKRILRTERGHAACSSNPDLLKFLGYLLPSHSPRKLKRPRSIADSIRQFTLPPSSRELWLCDVKMSHILWIRRLVCSLIVHEIPCDDIFSQLTPLCWVKSEFCQWLLPRVIHHMLIAESSMERRRASQLLLSKGFQWFLTMDELDHHKETTLAMLGVLRYLSQHQRYAEDIISFDNNSIVSAPLSSVVKNDDNVISSAMTVPQVKAIMRWYSLFWIKIDPLVVARAAYACDAFVTALFYVNLSFEVSGHDISDIGDNSSGISAGASEEISSTRHLLLKIYSEIPEPDGVYGINVDIDDAARLRIYEHEGEWFKALALRDVQLQNIPLPTSSGHMGLLSSMLHAGMGHTTEVYNQQCRSTVSDSMSSQLTELQYEAAWRNGTWSMAPSTAVYFNQGIYSCLYSLRSDDALAFVTSLNNTRSSVVDQLTCASLESAKSVLPSLTKLQMLNEMAELCCVCWNLEYDGLIGDGDLTERIESLWNGRFRIMSDDFEGVERVLALRSSVLRTLLDRHTSSDDNTVMSDVQRITLSRILNNNLVEMARAAQRAKQFPAAFRSVALLQSSSSKSVAWSCEKAEVLWAHGDYEFAIRLLRSQLPVVEECHASVDIEGRTHVSRLMRLLGEWLSATQMESPEVLLNNYFIRSVDVILESNDDPRVQENTSGSEKALSEAYFSMATFANQQYREASDRLESNEFATYRDIQAQFASEIETYQMLKSSHSEGGKMKKVDGRPNSETGGVTISRLQSRAYRRHIQNMTIMSTADEEAVERVKDHRMQSLQIALCAYAEILHRCNDHDLSVFQWFTLWFDNRNVPDIQETMRSQSKGRGAAVVPSFKFLPLIYQLVARLGDVSESDDSFQAILNDLVYRISSEHPHHAVWHLVYLANQKDECGDIHGNSATTSSNVTSRHLAADAILELLQQSKVPSLPSLVKSMRWLAAAYSDLAHAPPLPGVPMKKHYHDWPLGSSQMIYKVTSKSSLSRRSALLLDAVAIPTVPMRVCPDTQYTKDDFVGIAHFEPFFVLPGGINLPKAINVIGTDGKVYKQLVKRDDIRGDAVMMQVFSMANILLKRTPNARHRQLAVRTYRVIPLSSLTGVLQWVDGTQPLGQFLIGDPRATNLSLRGAHERYRPHDMLDREVREVLKNASPVEKLSVYESCAKRFKPVFRRFFTENFTDPVSWFDGRLAYTRSTACASIVGYVVGLGDRHIANILVDTKTAEVVHIDLGVAFEEGKMLTIPETVPFRLTRDIVDGMGVTGVEGVFRRCCEETLKVMRDNETTLLSIINVFVHDPLNTWTISMTGEHQHPRPKKVTDNRNITQTLDETCSNSKNVRALTTTSARVDRTLMRLKQKLQGCENGVSLSVSGQVNHLIREARDPNNLARLFVGWRPWC